MGTFSKTLARYRRQRRVRRRVRGTDARPRLCVFRSNRHTYAQVISDESGHTIAAVSTLEFDAGATGNKTAARKLGERVAELCREHQIRAVVFDRNGFLFHGRVKEVADGARAAGLQL